MSIERECEIYRGKSNKPLYVTCVGEELIIAKQQITSTFGDHRSPVLLKIADQSCREMLTLIRPCSRGR